MKFQATIISPHDQNRRISMMNEQGEIIGTFFLPVEYAFCVLDNRNDVLCVTKTQQHAEYISQKSQHA